MAKKQRGGKVLGKGSYGCAIAPAKMCTEKMDSKNKVSKLINMSKLDKEEIDELQEEYKISQKFKKIDPNNKYFLGGIDKCRIQSKDIKKSDLRGCKFPTKKNIPLLNIVMKKGSDFQKIAPKLSDEDLLKSLAHLLNGAKKSVYKLNLLLLDIKHLNILYVNSETEENKIHPVFIDFGPSLIATSKTEFKKYLKTYDAYYGVWPEEVLLTMYTNLQKRPLESDIPEYWKRIFKTKKEMMKLLKLHRKKDLEDFAKKLKHFNGFIIKNNEKEVEKRVKQFKNDINSKYKLMMDKIMVYEIANSFAPLLDKRPKLSKVIEAMLHYDYDTRLTIQKSLNRIKKEIGSVKEKDLLISYKKLTIFQKVRRFLTRPVNIGQKKGRVYKKSKQSAKTKVDK